MKLNPEGRAAWDAKGADLAGLGRYKEALTHIDKAIELYANCSDAWYHKGISLKALGQSTEAEAAFAKAKELGYTG